MPIPWIKIASTIAGLGRLALTARKITDQVRDIQEIKERSQRSDNAVAEQLEKIEEALETQARLNEQYNAHLNMVQSDFDNLRKSLRTLTTLIALALLMSIIAVMLVVIHLYAT